jgi:acyl-CoA reductase-like NAD-dependent aldehyde dehydrogenase
VQPTVILTKDPKSITMREEIFGPVVTVRLVVTVHSHVDRFFIGLCV